MLRDDWNRAFRWAKAMGVSDEGAVRAADRKMRTETVRQKALRERYNEYGMPRDQDPDTVSAAEAS